MQHIEQFEFLPLSCTKINHQSGPILSMCLNIKCNQPSAQCYMCTLEYHKECVSSIKMIKDIPQLLHPHHQMLTNLIQLQQQINQLMKELINSLELNLKPIKDCLETPNLTNLNNLGLFLKQYNQMNIQNTVQIVEKQIKIIFRDCKEKLILQKSISQIRVVKQQTKSAYQWFNEGLALDILNKFSESINCYSQVLNLQPTYKKAWYNKGIALMSQKRFLESIDCFQQVINLEPKQKKAFYNKGVALMNLQQFQEAIDSYQNAINIDVKYKEAWNNKGIALMNLQQFQEAIDSYEQAIKIDQKYKEAFNNIGVALMNLQKFQEAINYYQKSIDIDVRYKEAWCNQGLALVNQKRYLEAINCFQQAIIIDHKYTQAIKNKQQAEEQFAHKK